MKKNRDFQAKEIRKDAYSMLKKFEVKGFKGFKDLLVFDLVSHDYEFNSELIKNGIVNKALVYGKNSVGKSNLGIGMFDIISHMTDKERMQQHYLWNYRNYDSNAREVFFRYTFQFDGDEVVYSYRKIDQDNLVDESLVVNGIVKLSYNYFKRSGNFISKELQGDLNINLIDNRLSIVKYLYRNIPTDKIPYLTKLGQFCENMLWYRSLSDGNTYSGFTNGRGTLTEKLYSSGKVKEFQEFLHENGIDYDLEFKNVNGAHELYVVFEGQKAPFVGIASTGTMALLLYFVWSVEAFDKISLLFIDEFDAFFHYESAANIVNRLNKATKFQTILTSHNTYLMQNRLTRPDCCYIMTKNKITSLRDATDKEIREAHNLEKMYINGAFSE